jgi:protein-L-isoaspartate(D-aspartate) O-methyltransferase
MADYTAARRNMVENQIRTNRVTDEALLAVMGEVPRECFVPETLRGIAYVDEDIAIGKGRYLIEPLVLARLLQTAAVEPNDVVLDVGCATGYSTAVLARLANTVVAVESDPDLAAQATATLAGLGLDNAVVVEGPLSEGYSKQAPYDVIVLGGAVPRISQTIADQLGEGGRLVAVVTDSGPMGRGLLMTRSGGTLSQRPVFDAATPPLPGMALEPGFVF